MYKVVRRVKGCFKTVSYELEDVNNGGRFDFSLSEFRVKVLQDLVSNVKL